MPILKITNIEIPRRRPWRLEFEGENGVNNGKTKTKINVRVPVSMAGFASMWRIIHLDFIPEKKRRHRQYTLWLRQTLSSHHSIQYVYIYIYVVSHWGIFIVYCRVSLLTGHATYHNKHIASQSLIMHWIS